MTGICLQEALRTVVIGSVDRYMVSGLEHPFAFHIKKA